MFHGHLNSSRPQYPFMACFHPCLQERLHHLPRHSGPSLLTHQLTTPPQPSLWEQPSCWPFRLQSSPAGPPIPYLWSTTSSWEVNQITSGKVFQWLRVLGSSSSPCTWPATSPQPPLWDNHKPQALIPLWLAPAVLAAPTLLPCLVLLFPGGLKTPQGSPQSSS